MKDKNDHNKLFTFVDINVNQENTNQPYAIVYKFIILYFGTLGTISILVSSFDFGINAGLLIIFTFLFCCISYIVFNNRKKKILVNLIITGLFCIFIALFYRQIIISSFNSINSIIKGISVPYKLNLQTINVPSLGGIGNVDMKLFIFILTFLTALLVGYVVYVRRSVIIAMIVPFSFILFCISFDVIPSVISIVIVLAYFMSVISMTSKPKVQLNSTVPVIVFGMICLIFIVSYIVVPKANFKKTTLFETLHLWGKDSIDSVFDYGAKKTDIAKGGINGGLLGEYDNIIYSNSNMFSLKAAPNGGYLYYRSFYGAFYSNNKWSELPDEFNRKYENMFNEFKKKKIDTNNQTTMLLNIMDADEQLQNYVNDSDFNYQRDVIKKEFEISYYKADMMYWYLPYACTRLTDLKSSSDGYPINNLKGVCSGYNYNAENIDYNKIKELVDNYKGKNSLMLAYTAWESEYRKYVYDAYTIMPENSLEEMKAEAKKYSVRTESEKQAYINMVIDYLSKNYKYTLNPGKVPAGKDFIDYFLYHNKKGYCSYFATAATLMFRAAGIPARYVEGYSVSDDFIKNGTKSSKFFYKRIDDTLTKISYDQYSITVTDGNAHAWVEVYKDGYGWVPVDATPGRGGLSNDGQKNSQTEQATESTSVSDENTSVAVPTESFIDDNNSTKDLSEPIGSEDKNNLFFILVVTLSLVMILMIMIWYLSYKKAKKSLSKLMSMKLTHSTNLQITKVYEYIERLCSFLNLSKSETMDYEEYSKYLKENSKYFSECNIDGIIKTVLMVRFSNEKALAEDALRVTAEAFTLRAFVYKNLSRIDKIKFKYLYKL